MSDAIAPLPPISERIWDAKYRLKSADGTPIDRTIADTWRRVAEAAAGAEAKRSRTRWATRFHDALEGFAFLPAGRILAGAGTGRAVTLFNCFVMGRIEDDLSSIFDSVREAALTMQQGGGIGQDFSTLRPRGAPVASVGADASGPVSFMDVWDAMCRTIMSAGQRRGAMMATLACDHPDIEEFIAAKAEPGRLRNFNLSVLVSDAFVAAVRRQEQWPLVFGGRTFRTVPAAALWSRIMEATYGYAEPGVVFIDRVNARNNLRYCEEIRATNPCGEQPLPPYGACLLGSINLARLVREPFKAGASLDLARLEELVRVAVRFLDNVIDVSRYPLRAQRKEARVKRRIGLGVTGLADALAMTGLRYGEPAAASRAGAWMAAIQRAAYEASAELADEREPFPLYEAAPFLAAHNVAALPAGTRQSIARHGVRNGCLTSIAPTGTISLLAGNVSSGIEPIFDLAYRRRVLRPDGGVDEIDVEDYAVACLRAANGRSAPLAASLVTAAELTPRQHLEMQAALQPHVDSAISKTINCPADIDIEAFKRVYLEAFELGLKGCTTFRPNPVTGAVLTSTGTQGRSIAPATIQRAAELPAAAQRPGAVTEGPGQRPARSLRVPDDEKRASVLLMAPPLARDEVLTGSTYKLRWPGSDHAIYVTINDIERNGRRRPFEIFINTKNLEHYAWTVALTRMISAVFRRGGDVSFVVEELEAIFDPQGGQWMDGRYVPSLIAAIGGIIDTHLRRIGADGGGRAAMPIAQAATVIAEAPGSESSDRQPRRSGGGRTRCPNCRASDLVYEGGCWVCRACGESRCG